MAVSIFQMSKLRPSKVKHHVSKGRAGFVSGILASAQLTVF